MDDLHRYAAENDDRDASPAAVDVQIDDVSVEIGFGRPTHTAEVGADMCFSGDLPSPGQAQPPDAALDFQGLGQSAVRASETFRAPKSA